MGPYDSIRTCANQFYFITIRPPLNGNIDRITPSIHNRVGLCWNFWIKPGRFCDHIKL